MPAREWMAPLIVAAVTFAGLYVAQPHLRDSGEPHYVLDDGGYTYAYQEQPRVGDAHSSATVILLSRDAQTVEGIWKTPHVALQDSLPFNFDCALPWPCGPMHEVASPDEPRLMLNGFNATRVTAFIFDEGGILVFSNANQTNRDRFDQGLDASDLPGGVWYLGAASPAPNGTVTLPAAADFLLARMKPMLVGQPVGGVVSMSTNAFVSLYGTLFVTVQIDELVYAP